MGSKVNVEKEKLKSCSNNLISASSMLSKEDFSYDSSTTMKNSKTLSTYNEIVSIMGKFQDAMKKESSLLKNTSNIMTEINSKLNSYEKKSETKKKTSSSKKKTTSTKTKKENLLAQIKKIKSNSKLSDKQKKKKLKKKYQALSKLLGKKKASALLKQAGVNVKISKNGVMSIVTSEMLKKKEKKSKKTKKKVIKTSVKKTGAKNAKKNKTSSVVKKAAMKTKKKVKKKVKIPAGRGLGTVGTREFDLPFHWSRGGNEAKVQRKWMKAGSKHDSKGFCKLDGNYLIATTSTYGKVGDQIDFYMSDGTVLHTVMGDTKNQSDAGCNKWGHMNGKNIIEFMGSKKIGNNPYYTLGLNGKRVVKVVNHGSIL